MAHARLPLLTRRRVAGPVCRRPTKVHVIRTFIAATATFGWNGPSADRRNSQNPRTAASSIIFLMSIGVDPSSLAIWILAGEFFR